MVFLTSVLLPYDTAITETMTMMKNQYWLFPLWTNLYDFGNWVEYGVIIPPFLPSFSALLPISGLIWSVFGFYIALILNMVNRGQKMQDQ